MHNDELDPLINDPDLSTPEACRALLELARRRSPRDPDIAGDIVLLLSERLMPGGMLRRALATHPNPGALLNASAFNAANQARESAGRDKRRMPLTSSGVHDELEPPQYPYSPTVGLFDVLHDLGWGEDALRELAIPRKRPGRSIHPGISREQVQDATGFDLLWAEDLTTTPEPTQFQLDIIRHLDPNGIFLKGE